MYRGIHVKVRPGEPLLPGRAYWGRCVYTYTSAYSIYTQKHVNTCERSAGGAPALRTRVRRVWLAVGTPYDLKGE